MSAAAWVAVLIGGSLPLVALAFISRWRSSRVAVRVASRSLRRSTERARRPEAPRNSLAWLRATIGRSDVVGGVRDSTQPIRPCPHCRYVGSEPSVYCRRCGTRLLNG